MSELKWGQFLVWFSLHPLCTEFIALFLEEIALRTAEVAQLPPQVLSEEVICLDSTSSGSEDDSKGRLHSIKDGKNGWKIYSCIMASNIFVSCSQ